MVNMITCKHIPDRLFRGFTLDVQNSCTHHADFTILPKTHRNDDNDINICAGDRRNNREEKDTAHLETDSTRTRQTSKSLTHSTTQKNKIEGWTARCEKSGISSTATLDGLCIHVQPSKTINKKGTGSDRFGRQLLVDDGLRRKQPQRRHLGAGLSCTKTSMVGTTLDKFTLTHDID